MKRAAVVFALAMTAFSCGPRNYVVLLDNPGGGSGKVIVSNEHGRQVLDKSGSSTTINRAYSAPSSQCQVPPKQVEEVFSAAFAARPPRFVRYTLYFELGSTVLEPESEAQYLAMLAEVRRRPGVDAGCRDR